MIKKQIFVVIYFFSITIFSQVGTAIYGKQLKSFSENSSVSSNAANQQVKKILENLKKQEYQLSFNEGKAIYRKVKSLDNDENPVLKAMTEGVANFRGTIFFDSGSEEILHREEFAGVDYIVTKNKIDWTLTKDTLQIDNYLCYKAKTTLTIKNSEGNHELEATAWYAPEITIPYGPDGYGGLPGLILQLDYNGIITSLKKIEYLSKDETIDIQFPKKGKRVSEDEFHDIVEEQYVNRKSKY